MQETARGILAKAQAAGSTLILLVDAVVAREFKAGAPSEVVAIDRVPEDAMILDIGPATISAIEAQLARCRTLVWNGPVGAFETPPFDKGTAEIATRVAQLTKSGKLLSIAGGGDTVAALAHAGVTDDLSYVSTAGGAFLEWLEGRELPGVAALQRR
jgi:phosphoglycerate kinase